MQHVVPVLPASTSEQHTPGKGRAAGRESPRRGSRSLSPALPLRPTSPFSSFGTRRLLMSRGAVRGCSPRGSRYRYGFTFRHRRCARKRYCGVAALVRSFLDTPKYFYVCNIGRTKKRNFMIACVGLYSRDHDILLI